MTATIHHLPVRTPDPAEVSVRTRLFLAVYPDRDPAEMESLISLLLAVRSSGRIPPPGPVPVSAS